MTKRVAIIGSGISGLTSGYLLSKNYDVTLFEANDYIGGHTHTVDVVVDDKPIAVDTGFIVFNDRTYPLFNRLLSELDLPAQKTSMSFSVKADHLEYMGSNLNTLFAQRSNIFRPSFWHMIKDILRFNKQAQQDLAQDAIPVDQSLGKYLTAGNYSDQFIDDYILPMGGAIWSSGHNQMMAFPAQFFIRFFKHHGLLSISDRPQWYTLIGGSRSYIPRLTEPYKDKIKLNSPVSHVERDDDGVTLNFQDGTNQRFDEVVFACHSDQALTMLGDGATATEREILGAIPYRDNEVVLHSDETLLPKRKLAWAAWNYHLLNDGEDKQVAVTYDMNILQHLPVKQTICVTLNLTEAIDPGKILGSYRYSHPEFTLAGYHAQKRYSEIGSQNRSHFCGAYWFNGFHEDGVRSAVRVAKDLGVDW